MPGKRKRNRSNRGTGRSTGSRNKQQASTRTKVQSESYSEGSSGQVDSTMESPPLQVESVPNVLSGQKLPNSADKVPTTLAERDGIHLGTIFPAEVWRLIFDQLDNSADLENVSNSSLYFRDLLSPLRVNFLFHNVWNSFGELFYSNYTSRGNIYDSVIASEDWYKEIVKLRLVSHTWNMVIEKFYENHPDHFRLENYVRRNQDTFTRFLYTNNLLSNHERRRENLLLRQFAPTHTSKNRNPFLGKCVSISFHSGRDDNFIEGILGVLLEYGHHIWYCDIVIHPITTGVECYSRIWEVMQLMPNLKILRVDNWSVDDRPRLSARESEELQTEINMRPLPHLNKLQMLMTSDVLPSIFLELIRRNGHVNILDIDRMETRYRYGIFRVPLQNLKKLATSVYLPVSFLKMGRDTVNWPLTELHLDLKSSSTFIDWQTVFNILEKFKNTLTQLDLKLLIAVDEVDKERIDCDGHTFRLNLPFLTQFSVEMRNVSCFDFMLPMKDSLTELRVRIGVTDHKKISRPFRNIENCKDRIVKFLSCAEQLLDSNVWTLFPNLNKGWLNVYSVNSREEETHREDREGWQNMMKMLSKSDRSE